MAKKPDVKKPAPKAPAPAAKQPGTDVAVLQGKDLVLVQDTVPDHLRHEGAPRGSENVGAEDLLIPRLVVLQAISPEVTQGDPLYIKGAAAGMLMNSASKRLYGMRVLVVPVHYDKLYLVWKDRKQGGGFFGAYPDQMAAQERADKEGGKDKGVEVLDTPTHLCLLIDPETYRVDEVMVSMPRTKAKISRQWNSMVRMTGADRFARVYVIGTAPSKNAKGSYFNFTVAQSGFPAKPLYEAAKKLWETINSGQRNVVMDTRGMSGAETGGGEDDTDM